MTKRNDFLEKRAQALEERTNILDSATVYLSGPMDFVASREEERRNGWRTRVTDFLKIMKTTVYDPWEKPEVSGMKHYGKEDEFTVGAREQWTYDQDVKGSKIRAELNEEFWPTLHIDLRMTDLADFLIAYCPTNIYSVGTVHEIATARLQHKPVLLVTPPIEFEAYAKLESYLTELDDDKKGEKLFDDFQKEIPIKPNPGSVPSLWYMALLEREDYFFDGFGWDEIRNHQDYKDKIKWEEYLPLDERERKYPPKKPLLPYLHKLNSRIPQNFDLEQNQKVENADWLIFVDEDNS